MFPTDRLTRRFVLRGALATAAGACLGSSWALGGQRGAASGEAAPAFSPTLAPAMRPHGVVTAQEQPTEIGLHGMLVAGEETMYFSHFPMFTIPAHRFQAILEVTLAGDVDDDDLQAVYVADREESGATIYSIMPDTRPGKLFALRELLPESSPQLTAFQVTLFRGHFEREGSEPILEATANVERIVRFAPLDPEAGRGDALDYLLFGGGDELFLAHIITGHPDFDQLLTVEPTALDIPAETLRQGVVVNVAGRENTVADRLAAGESVTAALASVDPPRDVSLVVGQEFFVEEGELNVPDSPVPTAAEDAAGMP